GRGRAVRGAEGARRQHAARAEGLRVRDARLRRPRPGRQPAVLRHGVEAPGRDTVTFLPVSRADLDARGWDAVDVVIVSGDAYVDHPAFGPVLIARFLEGRGFRVGFIAQPDWRSAVPFQALGRPRLFFGVSAGKLGVVVNRLSPWEQTRSQDHY